MTSEKGVPPPRKALVNCFSNTLTNGFFSVGTTGTEWMDWASKSARKTNLVGAFAFSYATDAISISQGGPGASIGISFHTGTTGFCTRGTRVDVPGDADDVFSFTGLPATTGTQFSPGFAVTVLLPSKSVFCLPDGKIGWSYVFSEPPQGTTQNSTGPLLSGMANNTCWSDAFDLWSSPGQIASCAGVFFFSGCVMPLTFAVPQPCAGFWIKIFEEAIVPGSSTVFNDSAGLNPIRFTEIETANIGGSWVSEIFLDSVTPLGSEVAGLIRFGLPGTLFLNGIHIPDLLVNGSHLLVLGSSIQIPVTGPANPVVSSIPIPRDTSFLNSTFHTQGFAVLLSPLRLQALNGLSINVGVNF